MAPPIKARACRCKRMIKSYVSAALDKAGRFPPVAPAVKGAVPILTQAVSFRAGATRADGVGNGNRRASRMAPTESARSGLGEGDGRAQGGLDGAPVQRVGSVVVDHRRPGRRGEESEIRDRHAHEEN